MQGEGSGKGREACDGPATFPTAGTTPVRGAGLPSVQGPVIGQCESPLRRELKQPRRPLMPM
jgi:hypothetical protein